MPPKGPPGSVEELRAFGLTAYEAQAYAALLALGPADAATIGQRAGIPFGRVYDVLHGLVGRHLAQLREGRPKTFVPVPPAEALEVLLRTRKRELVEESERLDALAPALGDELARLGHAATLRGASYHVSLGRRDTRLTLAQVVDEAKVTLLAALEFEAYDPADRVIFQAIQRAAERGVEIRALLRPQDLGVVLQEEFAGPISELVLPYLGEKLEVRLSDKAGVPFSVTDDQRVTLGVRDPLHPAQHFAAVVLKDPKLAADLRGKFETLWASAQDVWDFVDADGAGLLAEVLGMPGGGASRGGEAP